uniref:Protein kinase domain-containing protein n=1 Tax=Chromera velia CCMP2878 TaxID=1169474 RepID=A0A0G4I7P2_9ALVE|eukprot:Cvel_11738.t1-p1 / transcript=Cvel_11738.t1 / gene=Cvel_11738 / organism=Chromera_velia_CCMP2878 / gene_product=hypothetical protein / transcript_product=hypothetical protein / location=Cvel_scaffold745:67060-67836(+) / protein_length=259 / sequence_SO=supercontig / SO=protein_coding / is_pseudo=false
MYGFLSFLKFIDHACPASSIRAGPASGGLGRGVYGVTYAALNTTGGIARTRNPNKSGATFYLPAGGEYAEKLFSEEEARIQGAVEKEACIQQYVFEKTGVAPQVFASWGCGGQGFVLMEKMGRDLHSLLDVLRLVGEADLVTPSGAAFSKKGVLREVADGILGALEALADLACMHGDMHGGNIMFDQEGKIRFVDFGMARCENPSRWSDEKKKRTVKSQTRDVTELPGEVLKKQDAAPFGEFKKEGTWRQPLSFWGAKT